MEKEHVIIYQDVRKKRFFNMKLYNNGNIVLSKPGQELRVNETEKKYLLKLKNGKKPMFSEKKEATKKQEQETKENEVIDHGIG